MDIIQLIDDRMKVTEELEQALLKAAALHISSVGVTERLRKALLQRGFTERTTPYGIEPGYVGTRNMGFLKAMIEGKQAPSIIIETLKEHQIIKSRIGKVEVK